MINNRTFLVFGMLLASCFVAVGQPDEFTFYPSISSGVFIGEIQLDGSPVNVGDWIAAFDSEGNCAGASEIFLFEEKSYTNLTIYGDDTATAQDEGMLPGEGFTLKLFRGVEQDIMVYPSLENPTSFGGWVNNNGAPLLEYNSPNDIYNFLPFTAPLQIGTTLQHPTCFDSSDGVIILTISGGTAPYTYLWNDGSTENPKSNLATGVFHCTVTDVNDNEEVITSISLNAPPELSTNITIVDENQNQSNGSAEAEVTGGTSPYTYLWNDENMQTTASAEGLPTGDYLLTITDGNDCVIVVEVVIGLITNLVYIDTQVANVSLFPNPVTETSHIVFKQSTNLTSAIVWRIDGTFIESPQLTKVNNNSYDINTEKLIEGIYFLEITTTNESFIIRLVK